MTTPTARRSAHTSRSTTPDPPRLRPPRGGCRASGRRRNASIPVSTHGRVHAPVPPVRGAGRSADGAVADRVAARARRRARDRRGHDRVRVCGGRGAKFGDAAVAGGGHVDAGFVVRHMTILPRPSTGCKANRQVVYTSFLPRAEARSGGVECQHSPADPTARTRRSAPRGGHRGQRMSSVRSASKSSSASWW